MVWRSLLSGDLPEVQAEGTVSLRAGMWNEFCVFKEVKESQCLQSKVSKVSKGEEAGDTVRETSRARPQRTSQALSRTLQFRLRGMGSFCGGAVRKWFAFIYLADVCTTSALKQLDQLEGALRSSCNRCLSLPFGGSNTTGRRYLYWWCDHGSAALLLWAAFKINEQCAWQIQLLWGLWLIVGTLQRWFKSDMKAKKETELMLYWEAEDKLVLRTSGPCG